MMKREDKKKNVDPIRIINGAMSRAYNQTGKIRYEEAGKLTWVKADGVSMHILSNVRSRLMGRPTNPTHKRQSSTDVVFEASDSGEVQL
jgi:hypothetical protein